MQLIEEQIARLEALDIPQTKRPDFDAFWERTMEKVRSVPLNVEGGTIEYPFPDIEVRDLTYEGLDGTKIETWLILPPEARHRKVPVVIRYHGASGSRGLPMSHLSWPAMGAAVIAISYRMQSGLTGSNTGFVSGGNLSWWTMGVLDGPQSCCSYHSQTDALRAVELALAIDEIDDDHIAIDGGSQGGATVLTVAALHPAVKLGMADVPSRCWIEKRIFDEAGSGSAVADLLRRHPDRIDQVCEVFSYLDNLNLADRIRCPMLISVGLKDPVCPPENCYAACNKIPGVKEIVPYPFGKHDGGGEVHHERKLRFFRKHFLSEA